MKELELVSQRRRLGMGGQAGIGVPDSIINKPAEITSHAKGRKNIEAGSVTSTGYARTASGGLTPVPSRDVKERIEDQFIPEMVWAGQNYIAPMFGGKGTKPPKSSLPKGAKDWEWNPMSFEWKPVKRKGKSPWQKVKSWWKKKTYQKNKSFYDKHKARP